MMQKLISLFALSIIIHCTENANRYYYVSSTGNDQADGTSPETAWQSLDKVNQMMAKVPATPTISFRRGDTFNGNLRVTKDSLLLTAYGEGPNPVISGMNTLKGEWTKYNNNIYQLKLSEKPENLLGLIVEREVL